MLYLEEKKIRVKHPKCYNYLAIKVVEKKTNDAENIFFLKKSRLLFIIKLVHVIQKIVGSQLLILVARKVYFQYNGPIKAHCFQLQQKYRY